MTARFTHLTVERWHRWSADPAMYSVTIVDGIVTKATGALWLLVGKTSDYAREFFARREMYVTGVAHSYFGDVSEDD